MSSIITECETNDINNDESRNTVISQQHSSSETAMTSTTNEQNRPIIACERCTFRFMLDSSHHECPMCQHPVDISMLSSSSSSHTHNDTSSSSSSFPSFTQETSINITNESELQQNPWSCPLCTYVNDEDDQQCVMCSGDRPVAPVSCADIRKVASDIEGIQNALKAVHLLVQNAKAVELTCDKIKSYFEIITRIEKRRRQLCVYSSTLQTLKGRLCARVFEKGESYGDSLTQVALSRYDNLVAKLCSSADCLLTESKHCMDSKTHLIQSIEYHSLMFHKQMILMLSSLNDSKINAISSHHSNESLMRAVTQMRDIGKNLDTERSASIEMLRCLKLLFLKIDNNRVERTQKRHVEDMNDDGVCDVNNDDEALRARASTQHTTTSTTSDVADAAAATCESEKKNHAETASSTTSSGVVDVANAAEHHEIINDDDGVKAVATCNNNVSFSSSSSSSSLLSSSSSSSSSCNDSSAIAVDIELLNEAKVMTRRIITSLHIFYAYCIHIVQAFNDNVRQLHVTGEQHQRYAHVTRCNATYTNEAVLLRNSLPHIQEFGLRSKLITMKERILRYHYDIEMIELRAQQNIVLQHMNDKNDKLERLKEQVIMLAKSISKMQNFVTMLSSKHDTLLPQCMKNLPSSILLSGLARVTYLTRYIIHEPARVIGEAYDGIIEFHATLYATQCTLKRYDLNVPLAVRTLQTHLQMYCAIHSRYTFLPHIDAVWAENGFVYVHEDNVDGVCMREWIKKKPNSNEIQYVFRNVLLALTHLSSVGYMHGNLNEDTIVIRTHTHTHTHEPGIVLLDFNAIGKLYASCGSGGGDTPMSVSLCNAKTTKSLRIISPEVLSNKTCISPASDVYCVGAMLFKIMFGFEYIACETRAPLKARETLREALRAMLHVTVEQRATVESCLDMTWFNSNIVDDLIGERELVRNTSEQRLGALKDFIKHLPRNPYDLVIHVERGSVIYGVITAMENASSDDLLQNLKTKYASQAESGIDEGGLSADLFTEFFLKIVSREENFFECAPEDDVPQSGETYLPNASNTSLSFFSAIGKFLAKSLVDSSVVPCSFSSVFFKFLLDIEPSLDDMFNYDETMAISLQNLLELPDCEEFDLEFELIDRSPQLITKQKRKAYVHKQIKKFLIEKRRPQLDAIKKGFYTLDGLRDQCKILTATDLQQMLCGRSHISFELIEREITFDACWGDSPTPAMTIDLLRGLEEIELRRFLRLCTSLACIPLEGLHRKIKVKKVSGPEKLPVGHTCFHVLDLPDYRDRNLVRSKMMMAIKHIDVTGFGYA